jgi:hypothetical protein
MSSIGPSFTPVGGSNLPPNQQQQAALQHQAMMNQQQAQMQYEQHVKQMQHIQHQQQLHHQQQQQHPAHSPMHPHAHSAACTNCDTFIGPLTTLAPPSGMHQPPAAMRSGSFVLPAREWPSFAVSQSHPRWASVLVKSENFDPLRAWMPWIEWDGSWLESFPLQTTFRVTTNMLEQCVKVLMARGFTAQQSRLAARM